MYKYLQSLTGETVGRIDELREALIDDDHRRVTGVTVALVLTLFGYIAVQVPRDCSTQLREALVNLSDALATLGAEFDSDETL